jgi:hypothetical protein
MKGKDVKKSNAGPQVIRYSDVTKAKKGKSAVVQHDKLGMATPIKEK